MSPMVMFKELIWKSRNFTLVNSGMVSKSNGQLTWRAMNLGKDGFLPLGIEMDAGGIKE